MTMMKIDVLQGDNTFILYRLQDEKQNKIATECMKLTQFDDLLSLPRETSKRGCQKTSQTRFQLLGTRV